MCTIFDNSVKMFNVHRHTGFDKKLSNNGNATIALGRNSRLRGFNEERDSRELERKFSFHFISVDIVNLYFKFKF